MAADAGPQASAGRARKLLQSECTRQGSRQAPPHTLTTLSQICRARRLPPKGLTKTSSRRGLRFRATKGGRCWVLEAADEPDTCSAGSARRPSTGEWPFPPRGGRPRDLPARLLRYGRINALQVVLQHRLRRALQHQLQGGRRGGRGMRVAGAPRRRHPPTLPRACCHTSTMPARPPPACSPSALLSPASSHHRQRGGPGAPGGAATPRASAPCAGTSTPPGGAAWCPAGATCP